MIELTEEAAITHGRSTFYKFFSSYFLDVPGKEFYQGLVDLENLKDRSEERRVGKECRSRWSPYH